MTKLKTGLFGDSYKPRAKDILSSRFLIPPFSVLSTREGWWQERKRQWISIGIQSELGRGYDEEAAAYGALGKPGALSKQYRNNMSRRYSNEEGAGLLKPIATDLRRRDSSPGGSPRPAMRQAGHRPGQPLTRGDGHGRPIVYTAEQLRAGRKATAFNITQGGQAIQNRLKRKGLTYVGLDDIDKYRHENKGVEAEDPIGGTSIFDPVLCELIYRWFCFPGGRVLDPFAGGSVRGIVAGELDLHYTGIDLSERQIAANWQQAKQIGTQPPPNWICGDSRDVRKLIRAGILYDLVFSCPPYGSLEQYSNDPRDISTLDVDGFSDAYIDIIQSTCSLLKPNGFACFVVGDYRDKNGFYCDLPGLTTAAFVAAGLRLYNEAILVNVTGSLPLRINAQFTGSRKLGKTHQNVLIYAKGNPREFVKQWPPLEI